MGFGQVQGQMRIPLSLSNAFTGPFDSLIAQFCASRGLIPDAESLASDRFLSRSVVPHVRKLSSLFNRLEEQTQGLAPYWKESANPGHLRLAYFLYFMPSNACRVAAIWSELARLGFRWPSEKPLRAIEFGAGPASGACGLAAGERHAPTGLPAEATWALIEQDKATLELGREWVESWFPEQGFAGWGTRPFHRKLDPKAGFLPRSAPQFDLWLMSYFLNEMSESPAAIAASLLESWQRHLAEDGLVILVEPALRAESRRLLEIRREILLQREKRRIPELQVLLPCLGHQACGALAGEEDWCHEEVSWWRPTYFRSIDRMAELDRKTLPFSYLVLARSRKPLNEILPALGTRTSHRLVSPAHFEGRDQEFFLCGQDGKKRARYKAHGETDPARELERGDVLGDAQVRGDARASRVDAIGALL